MTVATVRQFSSEAATVAELRPVVGGNGVGRSVIVPRAKDSGVTESTNVIELHQLYSERKPAIISFGGAALAEAIVLCSEALGRVGAGDVLEADDLLNQAQMIIPEVFYRAGDASDGLKALLIAIFHAFENRERGTVIQEQVDALMSALQEARGQPYMTMQQSAEIQLDLEDSGLNVVSRGIQTLMPDGWEDVVAAE